MIYPIVFIASSLSLAASVYFEERANNLLKTVFLCLAILVPSVLGGIRSEYIGTDNLVYRVEFINISNIQSFSQIITSVQEEPLYLVLVFFVSRFTSDYHWLCFVTELLTMIFITEGIRKFKNHIPVGIGMLIYLFCYYCNMLNLVRQGIALAICFYALSYAFERRWVKYCLLVVVAILFHSSAYIALLVIVVFKFIDGEKTTRNIIGLILISAIGLFLIPKLVEMLVSYGIFPQKYLTYMKRGVTISRKHTVYRLPILLLSTLFYRKIAENDSDYKYFYSLLWVEMISAQMASVLDSAYRISLYFGYSSIVVIPLFRWAFKDNRANRMIVYFLILLYVVLYWVYFCVFNNYGFRYPTFPFVSDII